MSDHITHLGSNFLVPEDGGGILAMNIVPYSVYLFAEPFL